MPTTLATNWLYLASSPVPSTAANAVHVAHMCDALLDHGFSVTLAAPSASWRRSKNSLMDQYGLRHEVPLSPLWKPKIRRGREIGHLALKWRLLTSNPALIYGRLLWGCCIAAEMNKPTVFEIHKPEWESGRSAREDFMRLIASPGFRAIVCISAALETHVLKSFPSLEGKTIVAHDAAPSLDRPECRKESKSFVVGYFGSLYEGKGVETLLEVAPLCPWAVFQIVGGGCGVNTVLADNAADSIECFFPWPSPSSRFAFDDGQVSCASCPVPRESYGAWWHMGDRAVDVAPQTI